MILNVFHSFGTYVNLHLFDEELKWVYAIGSPMMCNLFAVYQLDIGSNCIYESL